MPSLEPSGSQARAKSFAYVNLSLPRDNPRVGDLHPQVPEEEMGTERPARQLGSAGVGFWTPRVRL